MGPRARTAGRLAGLITSDSEPDFDNAEVICTVEKKQEAVRRPRGRPPNTANKVTKPAARQKIGKAADALVQSARNVLADKSNVTSLRASATGGRGAAAKGAAAGPTSDCAGEPAVAKVPRGRPKRSGAGKTIGTGTAVEHQTSSAVREIPETQQPEPMRIDEGETFPLVGIPESDADVDKSEGITYHEMDDVSVRYRLGELLKKYESLEVRHRDLREIGVKAAEQNFERLKKQADENIACSNELVAQLRAELETQSALALEGEQVRQELAQSCARTENLQAKVDELTASLSAARSEIKTLSTKLAASRNAEATMKAPGSALKAGIAGGRAATSEVVQAAQAKEDLYGDLTGLIVRGVRRGDEEDVFDCIQTGRNGTLHFKLALERGEETDSYDDVQFTYRPQLDEDRDGELMEMLPDYLVEEITFPRPHASKFYSRVIKSLTERAE